MRHVLCFSLSFLFSRFCFSSSLSCMCCLDFFFPSIMNPMLIGCLMRAFPFLLFLFLFSPLALEHTVDIHQPFSGHHQGHCYIKIAYCLFAHDTVLLMEYIPLAILHYSSHLGKYWPPNGSGLVSSLFDYPCYSSSRSLVVI